MENLRKNRAHPLHYPVGRRGQKRALDHRRGGRHFYNRMKHTQTNHRHLAKKHLSHPTVPFEVNPKDSVAATLRKMGKTSFQGRNLATVFEIWLDMLKDDTTIFLGVSGAMTAGGMKAIVRYLIENPLT